MIVELFPDGLSIEGDEAELCRSGLRLERDRRLVETDWTQLPDVPLPNRAEWTTYRQALRDLPNTIPNPGRIVDFPDPPT